MPKAAERQETDKQKRERLLTQAYGAATARVRDAHRDEFHRYYKEEASSRGLEWSPKLSPEERAEQTLMDLLDEFPQLAKRLRRDEAEDDTL